MCNNNKDIKKPMFQSFKDVMGETSIRSISLSLKIYFSFTHLEIMGNNSLSVIVEEEINGFNGDKCDTTWDRYIYGRIILGK
jgi:hypothetical protein